MGSFRKKTSEITAAVIYCRVSSEKQVTQGNGLSGQETRCREFAESQGLTVERVFKDEAISGGSDYRPAFFELLDFIESQKKPYAVIFDDMSRLARDVVIARTLRMQVESLGSELRCPNFEFEDSPENQLYATMVLATAEFERLKNRQRVIARQRARLNSGFWVFAPPRGYSFTHDPSLGKILVPVEPNASIIKELFTRFSNGEINGISDAARFLTSRNLQSRTGKAKPINEKEAKRILERVIYCGDLEYKKWDVKRRKAQHEPIISRELFERAQEILKGRKRAIYRTGLENDFPLRGIVLCSHCEGPLTASWSKGRNSRYPYYRCRNTSSCDAPKKSIKRELLEDDFTDLLRAITPRPELLSLAKAVTTDIYESKKHDHTLDLKRLDKDIRNIENEIERLVDQILSVSSCAVIKRIERRIEGLETKKLLLEEKRLPFDPPAKSNVFKRVFDFLSNPDIFWTDGNLQQKRMVQNLIFRDRLLYDSGKGFGTAELSLPFSILTENYASNNEMVEPRGVEPLTSSLPAKRSTS